MKKCYLLVLLLCPLLSYPQISEYTRISDNLNGLPQLPLISYDFAYDLTCIGLFNGDGIDDLLVVDNGTSGGDLSDADGELWLLLLEADGTVGETFTFRSQMEELLPDFFANYSGRLDMQATEIGDLNQDGITDLAILLPHHPDQNGDNRGAVLIAFLDIDARITDHYLLYNNEDPGSGAFRFSRGFANVGDINGDGFDDLAVGNEKTIQPGEPESSRNWVRLYFMRADENEVVFRDYDNQYGFGPTMGEGVYGFGFEISGLDDLNGDGWKDMAVGSPHFSGVLGSGETVHGGNVTILFLDDEGEVLNYQNINIAQGGFTGPIDNDDPHFGESIINLGDIDGNGSHYIAVGATWDNLQGNVHLGSAWVFKLSPAGMVEAQYVLSPAAGNVPISLADHDHLFETMTVLNDIDNDGRKEIVAGSTLIDDEGAAFILEGDFGGLTTHTQDLDDPSATIQVHPNPSQAKFRIETSRTLLEIRLFDTKGRLLQVEEVQAAEGYLLDLSAYPSGHYWAQCFLADGAVKQVLLLRMD